VQSFAQDEWTHGIGTGLFLLNLDGAQGFDTVSGPIEADLDLDTSELKDLIETAFGFGGFAKKGKWNIQYSLQYMELADAASGAIGLTPVALDITFEASGAEVAGVYTFAKSGQNLWGVLGGVRYTKHKFASNLAIGPPISTTLSNNFEHNWTDVLIGLTHTHIMSKEWLWNTRFDAGFGGSEGTYLFNTGATWIFAESWMATFFGKYVAVDFENGSRGNADWYLYDVDEFGIGATVLYVF
jgi:hypothetical protein